MEKLVDLVCMVVVVCVSLVIASFKYGGIVGDLSLGCLLFGAVAFLASATYSLHHRFLVVLIPAIISACLYVSVIAVALS